jgi:hypothetical protein
LLGQAHALLALKAKRLGNDRNGKRAHLFGGARNHRRRAGAGAAAHAARDKDHVAAFDGLLDLFFSFLAGALAELGVHPGAQAAGEVFADVDLFLGERVWRSCASVLMAIKSTPRTFSSTMWLTAFLPEPPTPMTRIRANASISGCTCFKMRLDELKHVRDAARNKVVDFFLGYGAFKTAP